MEIIKDTIKAVAAPAYTTIRQWLCKLGLYKLYASKNTEERWFYFIDNSVQMGPQKCTLVLGLRQSKFKACPTLADVEPLALRVGTTTSGVVIKEVLEEAFQKTGIPLAVISDEGSDLKKGVSLFSDQRERAVPHLFDISHKIDNIFKAELQSDKIWEAFKEDAKACVQNLKLTSLAHLSPPKQRTKGRMHSAFGLIHWGKNLLNYATTNLEGSANHKEKNKIEWIYRFQFSLDIYLTFEKICKTALTLVHNFGYCRRLASAFIQRTKDLCKQDDRIFFFRKKIEKILREEEEKVPVGKQYPGSSEIIESVFGKFKNMEGHHASSGFTSLVLGMPALVGELSDTIVTAAMKQISVVDTKIWSEKNLGQTYLSKRRQALFGQSCSIDLDQCALRCNVLPQN